MSHNKVFNMTRDFYSAYPGDYWFALLDNHGKACDWIEATNAKEARKRFNHFRSKPIPASYKIEKRGKVA